MRTTRVWSAVPMPGLARDDALVLSGSLPVLAVLTWWTFAEGGYGTGLWMPGGIVILLMLAITLIVLRGGSAVPRVQLLAIAALGGLALLSYLSIAWAGAPGAALLGAHRTVVYVAIFALLAALPWSVRASFAALTAWTLMVGVAGLVTALRVLGADGVESLGALFVDARLAAPIGYQNANAALWTMAAAPAVVLAARRETPAVLRPVLLAEAGLLLALALLAQSRGWLFAMPVILVGAALILPDRVRLLLFAAPVAVMLAVLWSTLGEPFAVGGDRYLEEVVAPLRTAAHDAVRASLWAALALLALGAAATAADRRVRVSPGLARAGARLAALLLVTALAGGVVAGWVATDGRPVDRASAAWSEFKDFDDVQRAGSGRLATLGSTRYDFWRVSVELVGEHPLVGVGQDNFAHDYMRRRATPYEEPRWTHSLELRLLVHTGIIGLLLFAAFVVAAVVGAARRRSESPAARRLAPLALLPLLVWIVHGSVDWLWELPALSGAALGFAAIAGRAGWHGAARERPALDGAQPRRGGGAGASRLAAAALGVVAAAALAMAWTAHRWVDDAATRWPADPARAFDLLGRARSLNPLDQRASIVEGLIAQQTGELRRAKIAFRRATEREPEDWFARFELGLTESARARERKARLALREALRRNPRDELIRTALRRAGGPRAMTFAEARSALAQRLRGRFSRAAEE